MKVLFKKLNTASRKRLLKKQAQKLYRSADAIYWHEMSKPRAERDEALMSECLQTMRQSSAILFGGTNRTVLSPLHSLRWAAACCAVIIALAAASTGLAYAKGINLWSFLFNHSDDGITIQGTTGDGENVGTVDFDSVPNNDGQECSNLKEAEEMLGINPLKLDLTNTTLMIDNIYIFKSDVMMELSVTYTDQADCLDYTVQVYNGDANTAFTTDILGSFDKVETYDISGMQIYTATCDEESALSWTDGEYVYQISASLALDDVLDIIRQSKTD